MNPSHFRTVAINLLLAFSLLLQAVAPVFAIGGSPLTNYTAEVAPRAADQEIEESSTLFSQQREAYPARQSAMPLDAAFRPNLTPARPLFQTARSDGRQARPINLYLYGLPEKAEWNAPLHSPPDLVGLVTDAPLPKTVWVQPASIYTDLAAAAPVPPAPEAKRIFLPAITAGPPSITVLPGQDTVILHDDGTVQIEFSPEAVEKPTQLFVTPLSQPDEFGSLPSGYQPIGDAFNLSVYTSQPRGASTPFRTQAVIVPATAETPGYVTSVEPALRMTIDLAAYDLTDMDPRTLGLHWRSAPGYQWERLPSYAQGTTLFAEAEQTGEFVVLAQAGVADVNRLSVVSMEQAPRIVLDPDDDVGHATWPGVGTVRELQYNLQLAEAVRAKLQSCTQDVLITRDSTPYVSRTIRQGAASAFAPDLFVTLAFNALIGDPWGSVGDGGATAYAGGSGDNIAFADGLADQVSAYTGRPNRGVIQGNPILPYSEFNSIPATLAHLEALFLDHNFDWPVINGGFDTIVDGVYAAILNQLAAQGFTCEGGVDPTKLLPPPPDQATIDALFKLGSANYDLYGYRFYRQHVQTNGDPVNMATGNYIMHVPLFVLPGIGSQETVFDLFYNGQDSRADRFGFGWSFPYSARAQLYSDESVSIVLADGRTYHFIFDGDDYTAPAGVFASLESSEEGVWTYAEPLGTTLTFSETVYGLGVLTNWTDRQGHDLTFEHDLSVLPTTVTTDSLPIPIPPLESITDAAGQTVNLTSDDEGRITGATLPDGRTFSFAYSDAGDLISITDANGGTRHYQYDDQHRITHHRDPEGIMYLQNIYDDEDRVVEQVDANGSHMFIAYDTDNGVTTFTDNEGAVTKYYYDDLKRVTQVEDALGNSEYFVYDDQYNVTTYTDKNGNVWTYTYDDAGNLLTETDPLGHITSYTYNDANDLTSMTDALGRTTVYTNNDDGRVVQVAWADGASQSAVYNDAGDMTSLTDANGNTWLYEYDSTGDLTKVTDPLGNQTRYTYDAAGRQTSVIDANSHTATFVYDGNDNVTRIVDPKGQATNFLYDLNDNLKKMTDRRGGIWLYGYDENLKLISETDPAGHVTTHDYDLMYNRISTTDPRGNVTDYGYDALYQLTEVEDALGGVTGYAYDANGNVTSMTDALGFSTNFAFDELNRLTQQTDALGGVTAYGYNGVSQLTSFTNPRGAVTAFEYDLRDRRVLGRDALGGEWLTSYDAVGNTTSVTDANGHTIGYEYDDANRLIRQTDAEGHVIQFGYDGVGNRTSATDGRGFATTFGFDVNDNLIAITDPLSGVTAMTYDAEDNLVSQTDPSGHTTQYAYALDGVNSRPYMYHPFAPKCTTTSRPICTSSSRPDVPEGVKVTRRRR